MGEHGNTALDMMIEQEISRVWEGLNAVPSLPLDNIDRKKVVGAWSALHMAHGCFEELLNRVGRSAELINNTPESDKLTSLSDQLTDLLMTLNELEQRLHENWRSR